MSEILLCWGRRHWEKVLVKWGTELLHYGTVLPRVLHDAHPNWTCGSYHSSVLNVIKGLDRNIQEATFVNRKKAWLKKANLEFEDWLIYCNMLSALEIMYFDFSPYLHPQTNQQTKQQTNPQTYWIKNVNIKFKILNRLLKNGSFKYKILGSLLCKCKYIISIWTVFKSLFEHCKWIGINNNQEFNKEKYNESLL